MLVLEVAGRKRSREEEATMIKICWYNRCGMFQYDKNDRTASLVRVAVILFSDEYRGFQAKVLTVSGTGSHPPLKMDMVLPGWMTFHSPCKPYDAMAL